MHSGRAFYPSRERIDHGKDALYLQSVERLTIAVDIELMLTVFLGIEPFHIAVESLIVQNAIVVGFKREHIHGHHVDVYLTVLHTSAITALIFVVHLWLVFHNYLVVLVKIDLTTFSHFTQFGLAPPPLYTYVLVHLGFEHAEFVEFSLRSHSKPSVTPGTLFETGPEINFAVTNAEYFKNINWDLIVLDEAHKLRNVYKKSNVMANALRAAFRNYKKVLLTATPLQNNLKELI